MGLVERVAVNIGILPTIFKESAGNVSPLFAGARHMKHTRPSLHFKVLRVKRVNGKWLAIVAT